MRSEILRAGILPAGILRSCIGSASAQEQEKNIKTLAEARVQ